MKKRNFEGMSALEIYKEKLSGGINYFPKGFIGDLRKEELRDILRYIIEELLQWDDETIKKKWSFNIIKMYHMGELYVKYGYSAFDCLDLVYPGRFKPWELKRVKNGYWTIENVIKATKWLIEEKLNWDDNEIRSLLTVEVFNKNGLSGMIRKYNDSPFMIIDITYPGRFKPWHLNCMKNYWNDDTINEAITWFVMEVLKFDEKGTRKVSRKDIESNGLDGMLSCYFHRSIYKAIDKVFPGRYKVWEISKVSNYFWSRENRNAAIKWLIEEKLGVTPSITMIKLDKSELKKYGLNSMIKKYYNGSLSEAIKDAYSELF